jgi:subtilisin-like proprotein convertase family protein
MGQPNLSQLFDDQARYILDQSYIMGASGNELSIKGGIVDPARPLRVTLVWTDAPGATTGAAYVNNLDLEVSVGGQTYKGNVFSAAYSIPGGSFDPANNVENVFLPPGLQGAFQVRVIARNIAGDGVPGNADSTDQDFALIITNGNTSLAPNLSLQQAGWQDSGGQIPGAIEPGETVDLYLVLANRGNLLASYITSKLAVTGGQASILNGSASYPDIPAGYAASNSLPFRLTVAPGQTCGQEIRLAQTVQYYPSRQVILPVVLPTGFTWSSLFSAAGLPKLIPDWPGSAASSPISVPIPGMVLDADVLTSISHPRASDLAISLSGPGSTPVTLSSGNGGSAANYSQTIFDDQAALSITQGSAPFTGSFRPQQAISAFNGKPTQGEWQLRVSDQAAGNSGQITQFTLSLRFATCDPAFYQSLQRVYLPVLQR